MATTYEAIATVTVGSGGAANIEFTSIPGTYTDLLVKISGRTDVASNNTYYEVEFNNSTTNFTYRQLFGDGSSAQSGSGSFGYFGVTSGANDTASTFGNAEIYIPNYAGSNNKSFSVDAVQESNRTQVYSTLIAGLWSITNAITSIKIKVASGNLVQYSSATLYGIKNS